MPSNRRSSTRHSISLPVMLSLGEESQEYEMKDLSLGGAFIATGSRLPMGTEVTLSFRVPTHESEIRVGGSVRWTSDEGIGIQFGGLRAAEVWSLNKYFEDLGD